MTRKEAIEILETMTAEPEDGQEARLSADELDAVLFAIGFIRSIADKGGRDNEN